MLPFGEATERRRLEMKYRVAMAVRQQVATSIAEYAVASASSTIVIHSAGSDGTVISGSWIASAGVERRKVVLPSRGAKTASASARSVKIANAIGAFQLVTTVVSSGSATGAGALC